MPDARGALRRPSQQLAQGWVDAPRSVAAEPRVDLFTTGLLVAPSAARSSATQLDSTYRNGLLSRSVTHLAVTMITYGT